MDEEFLKMLLSDLSTIDFLWNKKKQKDFKTDERHIKLAWAKIPGLLSHALRFFQNTSKQHADATHKCLEFCYFVGKNKKNRPKMVAIGFIPEILNVFKIFFTTSRRSEPIVMKICLVSVCLLRILCRSKSGRETLANKNGLEIFKAAARSCLSRDQAQVPPPIKDLEAIICSLCLRCLPLKQLPLPTSSDPLITFVLPEADSCRCPAEEASESDEDNAIEIEPGPDVSEGLAASFGILRTNSIDSARPHHLLSQMSCPPALIMNAAPAIPPAASLAAPTAPTVVGVAPAVVNQSQPVTAGSSQQQQATVTVTQQQVLDACARCLDTKNVDMDAFKKFFVEFGDEMKLRPDRKSVDFVITPPSDENEPPLSNASESFKTPMLRNSRSTVELVKKREPHLSAKNRCNSEQKCYRDFRRNRIASDPHPDSVGTSPERGDPQSNRGALLGGQAAAKKATNPSNAIANNAESSPVSDPNRKNCFYDQRVYAEVARLTKGVQTFVKLAYPDLMSAYPTLPLQELKAYPKALLRAVLKEVESCEKENDFQPRTVFDLDELCKNEREPLELSNTDEDRVGVIEPGCDHLKFESRFESGNLRKVIQVGPREYELILMNDINQILQHFLWYYFEVSNVEQDVPYTFKIVNCIKSKSMVSTGMQPCVFSVGEAKNGRYGWVRCGTNLVYYRNAYLRPHVNPNVQKRQTERVFNTSSFTVSFRHRGDVCYIAYHYPYTFTSLRANLSRWQKLMSTRNKSTSTSPGILYRKDILTYELGGNAVHLLTITAAGTPSELARRDVIVLSSRVHPGESNSSWMMQGTIDYLLSDHPVAEQARDLYVFKIVPMLNADGVVNGSSRCSLAGQDLNRQWLTPSAALHPSVYHLKSLLLYLCSVGKAPLVYCDYHGHSRKMNVFVYGNNPVLSWRKEDRSIGHDFEFYTLPEILEDTAAGFCLKYCSFQIQRGKECSARVNIWREMGVKRAYTMEASYGGFDRGKYEGCQVTTRSLLEMGEKMVESLVIMRQYLDSNRCPTRRFESSDADSDDSGLA